MNNISVCTVFTNTLEFKEYIYFIAFIIEGIGTTVALTELRTAD